MDSIKLSSNYILECKEDYLVIKKPITNQLFASNKLEYISTYIKKDVISGYIVFNDIVFLVAQGFDALKDIDINNTCSIKKYPNVIVSSVKEISSILEFIEKNIKSN